MKLTRIPPVLQCLKLFSVGKFILQKQRGKSVESTLQWISSSQTPSSGWSLFSRCRTLRPRSRFLPAYAMDSTTTSTASQRISIPIVFLSLTLCYSVCTVSLIPVPSPRGTIKCTLHVFCSTGVRDCKSLFSLDIRLFRATVNKSRVLKLRLHILFQSFFTTWNWKMCLMNKYQRGRWSWVATFYCRSLVHPPPNCIKNALD